MHEILAPKTHTLSATRRMTQIIKTLWYFGSRKDHNTHAVQGFIPQSCPPCNSSRHFPKRPFLWQVSLNPKPSQGSQEYQKLEVWNGSDMWTPAQVAALPLAQSEVRVGAWVYCHLPYTPLSRRNAASVM